MKLESLGRCGTFVWFHRCVHHHHASKQGRKEEREVRLKVPERIPQPSRRHSPIRSQFCNPYGTPSPKKKPKREKVVDARKQRRAGSAATASESIRFRGSFEITTTLHGIRIAGRAGGRRRRLEPVPAVGTRCLLEWLVCSRQPPHEPVEGAAVLGLGAARRWRDQIGRAHV